MASRTKQKEEARARRLAEEQAHAQATGRRRRIQMLGGVILIAAAIVGVAIAISSGGSSGTNLNGHGTTSGTNCVQQDAGICTLLKNIPQSGNTLGFPNAKVTVTEYGDLECSVCDAFALPTSVNTSAGTPGSGFEDQLINQYVRAGKAKLVFRSLETASGSNPDSSAFLRQQMAAYAAGLQGKAWYYIELFYHHQGQEGTGYVTQSYLDKLAKRIPGLDYNKWLTDSKSPAIQSQVNADEQAATARGFSATPTLTFFGPKGQAQPIQSLPGSFSQVQSAINSVS